MESEPVLAPAIIFSDGAIRDQNTGKITLVGVFHRLKSNRFPFQSPAFFATAFISNIRGHLDNLTVSLSITDEGGNEIAKTEGKVSAVSAVNRDDVAEIAFPIPPTKFQQPGYYIAVVRLDDEVLGSRRFRAEEQRQ